jgi:hypothetical protein
MADDKIVNLADLKKRREERSAKPSLGEDQELPDALLIDSVSPYEVNAFLKVLMYLRQFSPDGTGRIEFDDFQLRATLDHGHRQVHEDDHDAGITTTTQIELLLPFFCTAFAYEDTNFEEECSLEDLSTCLTAYLDELSKAMSES